MNGEKLKIKIIIIAAIIIFPGCKRESRDLQTQQIVLPEIAEAPANDKAVTTETELQRGEGPFNIMERLKIDRKLRQGILESLANETDFTRLKVGERFAGIFDPDTSKLLEFVYFQNIVTTHRVKISYSGDDVAEISYVLEEKPNEVRYRLIRGTLNSVTLDAELRGMGLPLNIVGLATNILEAKISFRTAAKIGDEFELLLQETFYKDSVNGEIVDKVIDDLTSVLFVSYSGKRAGTHKGYRYFDGDKSSYNAHYTEDGEALISSGLRYPLDRVHITSGYGYRTHPVTGARTMHNGVDYRAGVGAPVYAVAEGRVVESRYDGLSGNFIAIRHKDNTTSYYLHLSKRSVNAGASVRARQVIGLAGNSGQTNGPHLHFGFKQANGNWMNPLQKRMIAAEKLTGEKLEKLKEQISGIKKIYREQLDSP